MAVGQPDKDRREHESWLHDALELSLFERFQPYPRGNDRRPDGGERALILHGQRSGPHPDFALLDANQKLILFELKRGKQTKGEALEARDQLIKYARVYPDHRLGELATWYCQHGVDVRSKLGHRGDGYIVTQGDYQYGRLNRWSLDNLKRYADACHDSVAALDILRSDYSFYVERNLDAQVDDRLAVARCILAAEGWPSGFDSGEVNGVKIELWTYPPPAQWVGPAWQRDAPAS